MTIATPPIPRLRIVDDGGQQRQDVSIGLKRSTGEPHARQPNNLTKRWTRQGR